MKLTPLQRDIQQRADKTLNFGCIVNYLDKIHFLVDTNCLVSYDGKRMYENEYDYKYIANKDYKVIGHPMNWGRLCYLGFYDTKVKQKQHKARLKLYDHFSEDKERYILDVITRSINTQELVLAFLKTLGN